MRAALAVGLALYKPTEQGGLGSLSGPHLAALRIQQQLQEAGFHVILRRDLCGDARADRKGLHRAIQEFRELLRNRDEETVAFFYYAGHGGYDGKHHFLMPTDCELGIDADVQGIDFEGQVLHHMVRHAHRSIAVLDCCRTGQPSHAGPSSLLDAPQGHQYLVCHACAAYAKAQDCVYTTALLKHIFQWGTPFTTLVGDANELVARTGTQVPELGPHCNFSRDFVLVDKAGWRFAHRLDTGIHCDIKRVQYGSTDGIANVKQFALAAEQEGTKAVAFNTLGYIKSRAGDPVIPGMPLKFWPYEPKGVFVRDKLVPSGWLFFPGMDSCGNNVEPRMKVARKRKVPAQVGKT